MNMLEYIRELQKINFELSRDLQESKRQFQLVSFALGDVIKEKQALQEENYHLREKQREKHNRSSECGRKIEPGVVSVDFAKAIKQNEKQ